MLVTLSGMVTLFRELQPEKASFMIEVTVSGMMIFSKYAQKWKVPTSILYGSYDNLTSFETISDFAKKHRATLTVMESGEHWFHTEDQMRFLDEWILREEHKSPFQLKNNGK